MTHLEEQFFNEFNNPTAYSLTGFELEAHYARIAAKIALELAEKAYHVGRLNMGREGDTTFKQFIQDYE